MKYTEADREWMVFKITKLKKQRKAKSKAYWLNQRVEEEMPESLLMTDTCLMNLVKQSQELDNKEKVCGFLYPWPSLHKYVDEIFYILQLNSQATKVQQKEALKEARTKKKAKFINDEVVAITAKIMELRDQQLLKHNKITPDLKAQLKKVKKADQKYLAKLDANREKARKQV